MEKKIDLGCGTIERRKANGTEDYIGVDYGDYGQEIKHDLRQFPYPFEDNSIDVIFSAHCLENLINEYRDFIPIFNEMLRISKPGAKWILIFPHWSRNVNDIMHNVGLEINFLRHFIKGGAELGADVDNYAQLDLNVVKKIYKWRRSGNARWDFIFYAIDKIWSKVLNWNIAFTENFLIYKLGGIQEFRLEIEVNK